MAKNKFDIKILVVLTAFMPQISISYAACGGGGKSSINSLIISFNKNPGTLLEQYTHGEAPFPSLISDMIEYNPDSIIDQLQRIRSKLNFYQKKSVGTAIALAVKKCQSTAHYVEAEKIKNSVNFIGDNVIKSYFELSVAEKTKSDNTKAPNKNDLDENKKNFDISDPRANPFKIDILKNPFSRF